MPSNPTMADVWQDALGGAYPQWEAVIRHLGWHSMLTAIGYALAGTLCGASGLAARRGGDDGSAWFLAAGLLALIGANAVARIDLLAIYVLREVAHAQGWYEHRREGQFLALGALAAAGLLALAWLRTRLQAMWSRCASAVLGIGLLTGIAVLRAVSFHATDLALNASLFGVSTGRLLEFAGLGLTAAGALRWSRTG
jgi:hypothetical protein